jgi:hypothetical protein
VEGATPRWHPLARTPYSTLPPRCTLAHLLQDREKQRNLRSAAEPSHGSRLRPCESGLLQSPQRTIAGRSERDLVRRPATALFSRCQRFLRWGATATGNSGLLPQSQSSPEPKAQPARAAILLFLGRYLPALAPPHFHALRALSPHSRLSRSDGRD